MHRITESGYTRIFDSNQCIWDIHEDMVYDVLEGISNRELYYKYSNGKIIYMKYPLDYMVEYAILSHKWITDVSELIGVDSVNVTYRSGYAVSCEIRSDAGMVIISKYQIYMKTGSPINDAKVLIDSGLAEKYIDSPTIADAMHILHVSGTNRYYDLIQFPGGGHIPVDILEDGYDISWEVIASIPRGEPRDDESFACPFCNRSSFYGGICAECRDSDDPEMMRRIITYNLETEARKRRENKEIFAIIEEGDFSDLRYIRTYGVTD